MSYLHCHSCNWSQDDFWSIGGWNPIAAVKNNDDEKTLFEEKAYYDKNFFDDVNEWLPEPIPCWRDEKGYYTKGQYVSAVRFYQLYSRCINMKWKTYEEYKKDAYKKCPKCGKKGLCID